MIVLVDTNVLIDVLAERSPFVEPAMEIWALVEKAVIRGFASAVSLTTIFYYARKLQDRNRAHAACQKVIDVFELATVDAKVVNAAMASGMSDFEDAVQAFAALQAGATHIVSRDVAGFRGGPLPVLTPEQLLALFHTP